jgi:hypothetical protein
MKTNPLSAYLDNEGRVIRWPGRKARSDQDLILAYLADKFELEREYTEREVNNLLKRWHTFEDWALLRRELFERAYINRTSNGSAYWRTPDTKLY